MACFLLDQMCYKTAGENVEAHSRFDLQKQDFLANPILLKIYFQYIVTFFSIHDEELFACTLKAKSFFFHFYRNESTPIISIVLLAIFACISMILVIIVLLGYKIGWIRFNCPQRNKKDSRGNVIIKHNRFIERYLELRFHTQQFNY